MEKGAEQGNDGQASVVFRQDLTVPIGAPKEGEKRHVIGGEGGGVGGGVGVGHGCGSVFRGGRRGGWSG